MAIQDIVLKQDCEDPTTILFWEYHARQDSGAVPVSDYMFENGDELVFDDTTIPTAQYTSPEFAALEAERLWPRAWQVACRVNEIPKVGDYVEYEIIGRSILIVRESADSITAYYNACRHRGTALASGTGSKKGCFVCPFHGWTYTLDGALDRIPAKWDFPQVDQENTGLRKVKVEVFDTWVFINLDDDAPPLSEHLGETVIRHMSVFPDDRHVKTWHYGQVVQANWKVMAEAFMEAYHIARTHPQLTAYAGDLQTKYDAWGAHSRLTVVQAVPSTMNRVDLTDQEIIDGSMGMTKGRYGETVDESSMPRVMLPEGVSARRFLADVTRESYLEQGIDLSHVSDTEMIDSPVYTIFPNFMVFRGATGHIGYRFRPYGSDPNYCIYEIFFLAPVAPGAELPKDASLTMIEPGRSFTDLPDTGGLGLIIDQDVSNSPLVQKGLHGLESVNMASHQEKLILNLHHHLVKFMA